LVSAEGFFTQRLVLGDVEGNGRQPQEIVEVALLVVEAYGITEPLREWLVRPSVSISPMATSIHGIRNDDVSGAVAFAEVAHDIQSVLRDSIFVAHNAWVDHGLLVRQLPTWQPAAVLDTLKLSRALFRGAASYGLTNLLEHLGLPLPQTSPTSRPHRAGFDVMAVLEVLKHVARHDSGGEMSLEKALAHGAIETGRTGQGRLF
jgi:DNA polymerase III epsilon subunit-like protein